VLLGVPFTSQVYPKCLLSSTFNTCKSENILSLLNQAAVAEVKVNVLKLKVENGKLVRRTFDTGQKQ
jgi:hypothetical protein